MAIDNLVDVTDFCKASDFALQDVFIKKLQRYKMHLAFIQQLRNVWLVGVKWNCKRENSYEANAFVERPSWHPFLFHCSSRISVAWKELSYQYLQSFHHVQSLNQKRNGLGKQKMVNREGCSSVQIALGQPAISMPENTTQHRLATSSYKAVHLGT